MDRRPDWRGPLKLMTPPERIDCGWWHRQDMRRDYYMALATTGALLWVYRDRAQGKWFLHGFFS